jgi:ABC-type glycerol-3-phosphate transport system permease component
VTTPFDWSNYVIAFNVLKRSILNSLWLAAVNTFLSLALAAIGAYVFARFRFPGREIIYWSILGVLFVPGILTFATRYALVAQLGMIDTFWALIVPYIAGAQIFQTIMLRSFFAGIPDEIVDSAQVDGAGVFRIFFSIILPMSRPILATLAVMRAMDFWNEWLWASITIFKWEMRPMALQVFYLASDIGAHVGRQMAGFVIASIPLVILFAIASKQFVEGLTSGALKF